jgi:hypothetical protein
MVKRDLVIILRRAAVFAASLVVLIAVGTRIGVFGQAAPNPLAPAGDAAVCSALAQEALAALEPNCTGMGRNTACYGYRRVAATFTQEVPDDFFSQPADRADVVTLRNLTTSPMQTEDDEWGVALMSVQGNLPNTLPGQAVTFVLMGDAEVVNAVPAEEAALPVEPIGVIATRDAVVRTGPSMLSNAVGAVVTAGSPLAADARSDDGAWLRVVFAPTGDEADTVGGWFPADAVAPVSGAPALSTLPVIGPETRSPMQAFLFRTGLGGPRCEEAPSTVVVQGPNNTEVLMNVNGADLTLGSTVQFNSVVGAPPDIVDQLDLPADILARLQGDTADDQQCALMQVSVINGAILVNEGRLTLPEGFTAWAVFCAEPGETIGEAFDDDATEVAEFSAPTTDGLDGAVITYVSFWGAARPLTEAEIGALAPLEDIPGDVLNYPIDLPRFGIVTATPTPTPGTPGATAEATAETTAQAATPIPTGTPLPTPNAALPASFAIDPESANQNTVVGGTLARPFSLTALNGSGQPIANTPITFTAPASGASGTFERTGTNTETVLTDASGVATTSQFTLNTIAGVYAVVANSPLFALGDRPLFALGDRPLFALGDRPLFAQGDRPLFAQGDSPLFAQGDRPLFAAAPLPVRAKPAAQNRPFSAEFSVINIADVATSLVVVSGSGQAARVGEAFAEPLVVRISDQYDNPVIGANIRFEAPVNGPGMTIEGSRTHVRITDRNGLATTPPMTAVGGGGAYSVAITHPGLSTSAALTNGSGIPATIEVVSGDGQSAPVTQPLAQPLRVRVVDDAGLPVAGETVMFIVVPRFEELEMLWLDGDGPPPMPSFWYPAVIFTDPTVVTDAGGFAETTATADRVAGEVEIEVMAGPISTFMTSINLPGPAAQMSAFPDGSVQVGNSFGSVFAYVEDAFGNRVPDASVQVNAPATGASASLAGQGPSAAFTTDSFGQIEFEAVANTISGSYLITLLGPNGASTQVSLTNTPGPLDDIVVSSGNGQSAEVATAFADPIVFVTVDQYGNPVPSVPVTLSQAGGPAAVLSDTTITTDASGTGQVTAEANTAAGTYTVVIESSDDPDVLTTFSLTNTPGPASSVTLNQGDSQTTTVGQEFGDPLVVFVTDQYGNEAVGTTVTFSPPGSGASALLSDTTVTVDALGLAATFASANTVTGVYTVGVSIPGFPDIVAFTLRNDPGAPASLIILDGDGQATLVDTPFATDLQVRVTDAFGNGVEGQQVNFTAPSGSEGPSAILGGLGPNYGMTANSSGIAFASAEANSDPGTYTVTAEAGGLTVLFSLENTFAAVTVIDTNLSAMSAPGTVIGGDDFTVTLDITNNGPDAVNSFVPIVVDFSTPSGLTFVSRSSEAGVYTSDENTITVTDLAAGGTTTVTTVYNYSSGFTEIVISAARSGSSGGLDIDPGNDTRSVTVFLD